MPGPWRVKVCDDEQWAEFRDKQREMREAGIATGDGVKQLIAETGETVLHFYHVVPSIEEFLWACPGCGHVIHGVMGDKAVSGWDEPRWVNTGTREKPTMTPSFGCPNWRQGECFGHYWLRDGVVSLA